jgi:uncharacterized membrane protein
MFSGGRHRRAIVIATAALFSATAWAVMRALYASPLIDVFVFQQMASAGVVRGVNPYVAGYPNLYGPGTPFYGPGVVDATNHLTVGLPYPPFSLLLALPGYLLGGDFRYAEIVAVALSAVLMASAVPDRWSALSAALFLLTPTVFFVLGQGWSDTLFVFTFSLVMFCAVRWRRGLPYALGAFLATKQYGILSVPLIPLLFPGDRLIEAARVVAAAICLAALVTAPFFLWDPHAFWRAVVQFQFMQPLRMDSLSHLVWMRARLPWSPAMMWIPFALLVPAIAAALRRCPRTPAGFAGAVAIVHLVFFAFSKQAFTNYYYFVIAAAAWAAAAAGAGAARAAARETAGRC